MRTRAIVNLCECVCAGVVERKRRKIKRCVVKITLAVRKSGVTREQNRTETKRNAKKKKITVNISSFSLYIIIIKH